jgi:hypothetical protein
MNAISLMKSGKMESKYSLAIHDLRVSGNETTVDKIKNILDTFRVPLSVHLVFDVPLEYGTTLYNFISENIKTCKIEIVFHGLTHSCSKKVFKWLAFYHKYQAEYMVDSDLLRTDSALMYHQLANKLGYNPGICPPCWISLKKNVTFFKSLNPSYIETLLYISNKQNKIFSAVLSLASKSKKELFFLKLLAKIIYFLALLFKIKRLRVAIHECDLDQPQSIFFFQQIISSFEKQHFRAVLLKELI